jgi:hypothetical protein
MRSENKYHWDQAPSHRQIPGLTGLPAHWTIQARQLANIKRLAERHRAQARREGIQQ